MNSVSEIKEPVEKLSRKMGRVCDYSLKSDYDITMALVPDDGDGTPACTHHFKGNLKHNFLCLLSIVGIVSAICAAGLVLVHGLCSFMCK